MSLMRVRALRVLIFQTFFGTVETELKTMWFAPLMLGLAAAHQQNLAKEEMELRDFFAGHGLRLARLSVV